MGPVHATDEFITRPGVNVMVDEFTQQQLLRADIANGRFR